MLIERGSQRWQTRFLHSWAKITRAEIGRLLAEMNEIQIVSLLEQVGAFKVTGEQRVQLAISTYEVD